MKRSVLTAVLVLSLVAPAFAQDQPVWVIPSDQITVVSVGTSNGLPYATIRDNGMKGHNIYCVAQGAHFGKLTVERISADGVTLSDGRVLPVESAGTTALASNGL